jgi:hypothetical protein
MWTGFNWLRVDPVASSRERGNEPLRSIKRGEFRGQLSDHHFLSMKLIVYRKMLQIKVVSLYLFIMCPLLRTVKSDAKEPKMNSPDNF